MTTTADREWFKRNNNCGLYNIGITDMTCIRVSNINASK